MTTRKSKLYLPNPSTNSQELHHLETEVDQIEDITSYMKNINKTIDNADSLRNSINAADVNHIHNIVTASSNGMMSSVDKTKLDSIENTYAIINHTHKYTTFTDPMNNSCYNSYKSDDSREIDVVFHLTAANTNNKYLKLLTIYDISGDFGVFIDVSYCSKNNNTGNGFHEDYAKFCLTGINADTIGDSLHFKTLFTGNNVIKPRLYAYYKPRTTSSGKENRECNLYYQLLGEWSSLNIHCKSSYIYQTIKYKDIGNELLDTLPSGSAVSN